MTSKQLIASLAHDPARQAQVEKELGSKRREPRPPDGYRSGLEKRYAAHLNSILAAGIILWWGYETSRRKLANGAYYKPDFEVLYADGHTEYHETKGHWRPAARVRIKVAAEHHPYRFIAVTREAGEWCSETFDACYRRTMAGRGQA